MNNKAPIDRTRPIDTDQKYLKKRFEFYFEKGDEGECWEWERAIVGGYGAFTIGNTQYRAHRVSYQLYHGEDPDGMLVLHDCDNPKCVNPEHLHLGTHSDNAKEGVERGRITLPDNDGSANGQAKLTEDDVREIRQRSNNSEVTYRELADDYGVSPGAIGGVVRGETWTHVEAPDRNHEANQ